MVTTPTITSKQWNQLKACMTFWLSVAETSRVHPSDHPSIKNMFDEHDPLTDEELEGLLHQSTSKPAYVITRDIATQTGCDIQMVRYYIRKHKIKLAFHQGIVRLYHYDDAMKRVYKDLINGKEQAKNNTTKKEL